MSKASTTAKNKYNKANYDRIGLMLPKGMGEQWKAEAVRRNMSLNAFIQQAVSEYIQRHSEE